MFRTYLHFRLLRELDFFLIRIKYYIFSFGAATLCTGLFQLQQVLFFILTFFASVLCAYEWTKKWKIMLLCYILFAECIEWKSNAFSTVCSLFVWYSDIVHDLSWWRNHHSCLWSIKRYLCIKLASIWLEFKVYGLVYD